MTNLTKTILYVDCCKKTICAWKIMCKNKQKKKKTNRHMKRCVSWAQMNSAFDLITSWLYFFYFRAKTFVEPKNLLKYRSFHSLSIHIFWLNYPCTFWCVYWWSTEHGSTSRCSSTWTSLVQFVSKKKTPLVQHLVGFRISRQWHFWTHTSVKQR